MKNQSFKNYLLAVLLLVIMTVPICAEAVSTELAVGALYDATYESFKMNPVYLNASSNLATSYYKPSNLNFMARGKFEHSIWWVPDLSASYTAFDSQSSAIEFTFYYGIPQLYSALDGALNVHLGLAANIATLPFVVTNLGSANASNKLFLSSYTLPIPTFYLDLVFYLIPTTLTLSGEMHFLPSIIIDASVIELNFRAKLNVFNNAFLSVGYMYNAISTGTSIAKVYSVNYIVAGPYAEVGINY